MRRLISIFSLLSAMITSVAIILTLLTTYQFIYINEVFNSYYPIQIGLSITMIFWGIRFFLLEKGSKKLTYPLICFIIATISIVFMGLYVK
ncbi:MULTISPECIES: hypothetical protein [Clostridium]|jgi:hypothetical protein|uniref:Uncharacterized protein n=1 Tax=Clostridium manihotivorum TaxID=2320868 RepID=A0A410DQ26_9CLOT|nr:MULTISPECIES: hypothetical protein [Clostridium]QAA31204.1 hypothetical protein C1I91_05735 [Clostridium manihotivorum]